MSNLSELFPQSSSGLPGAMTKDPKLVPVYDGTNGANLYDSTTQTNTGNATFWSELDRIGAYVTGATDDTYKEICSLTGAGFLFHIIPPTITNTSDTVGFRITVDGTVYEILKTQTWAGSSYNFGRVVWGVGVDSSASAKYTSSSAFLRDFAGGQSDSAFRKNGAACALLPPSEIINDGMPCLRFEESLIVETKVTDVFTGATYGDYCGASYLMD